MALSVARTFLPGIAAVATNRPAAVAKVILFLEIRRDDFNNKSQRAIYVGINPLFLRLIERVDAEMHKFID